MSAPLVSVIIPTYNRRNFLLSAVDCVLQQTYQNFEIIIVDDGSTDGTKDLMTSFTHEKVKYVLKDNGGPAVARNEGIRHSRGSYICFLDSDDLWLPQKIENQVCYLRQDTTIDMVFCNFRYINMQGNLVSHPVFHKTEYHLWHLTKDLLEGKLMPTPPTVMIKRSALEGLDLFDPRLKQSEDFDFWLRMSLKRRVYFQNEVLAHIRLHDISLTRSRMEVWAWVLEVIKKNKILLENHGIATEPYFAKFYLLASRAALLEGKKSAAYSFWIKALKTGPWNTGILKGMTRLMLPPGLLRKRFRYYLEKNKLCGQLQDYY